VAKKTRLLSDCELVLVEATNPLRKSSTARAIQTGKTGLAKFAYLAQSGGDRLVRTCWFPEAPSMAPR
jgi:hypothetical protein